MQPQRKQPHVGLKTALNLGAKLWNANAILYNDLRNEDFLTLKRTVNGSNLNSITYDDFQYLRKPTSALVIHVLLAVLLFSPSLVESEFQYLFSTTELWMILLNVFSDPLLTLVYISNTQLISSHIFSWFLCFVYIYMYTSALYICIHPGRILAIR